MTHVISVFVCQVRAQVVSICVRISSEKPPIRFLMKFGLGFH